MGVLCAKRGESWDLDTVLHEDPEEFERRGSLILACPAATASGPNYNRSARPSCARSPSLPRCAAQTLTASPPSSKTLAWSSQTRGPTGPLLWPRA